MVTYDREEAGEGVQIKYKVLWNWSVLDKAEKKKRCYVVISWICYHLSTVWFNEVTVSIAVFYIFFQAHYDMYNAFSNHYNMNISIEKLVIVTFLPGTHCIYQNGSWGAIKTNLATKCFHVFMWALSVDISWKNCLCKER